MKGICYACGAMATTREHVPARGLFPKAKDLPPGEDLRRDLMTVPSCREHNTEKSGDDDFLVHVLAGNLSSNSVAFHHAMGKLVRAAGRKPGLARRLLRGAKDATHHVRTGSAIDAVQLELDQERLEQVLTLVARALYRGHYGDNWMGTVKTVPEFAIYLDDKGGRAEGDEAVTDLTNLADSLLASSEHLGSNPSVFTYQVSPPRGDGICVMRMNFYGDTKVLALFGFPDGPEALLK